MCLYEGKFEGVHIICFHDLLSEQVYKRNLFYNFFKITNSVNFCLNRYQYYVFLTLMALTIDPW